MTAMNCIDVYSAGERGLMARSQSRRARRLHPVIQCLQGWQVTADMLTGAALVTGMAAAGLLLAGQPVAALIVLALHVFLDGLDGPLARATGTASSRGSFTDTTSDQLVVAAVIGALAAGPHLSALPAILFLFVYTVVVCFAMIRNALGIPYSWLVRPRFVLYAWIPVELFLWQGSLDLLLWLCTALLALKLGSGFWKIRARM